MCVACTDQRRCLECGAVLPPYAGIGRLRKYCVPCGRRASHRRFRQRQKSRLPSRLCVICGKAIHKQGPGRKGVCCSPQCRSLRRSRDQSLRRATNTTCIRCGESFQAKTQKARLCTQCQYWRPSRGQQVECMQCGRGFYRRPSCSQAYCSRKCLHDALKTWHRCRHCDKVFSRRKYRASDKREYCCIQCYWDANGMDGSVARRLAGRHTGNTRKRCRKMGVPYDPSVTIARVAERDANQCQICRRQCNPTWLVSKTTRRPHPRNRTIDHIVPIAAGRHGHEWHNVQCACLACNVKKGSRWSFGQLRLL